MTFTGFRKRSAVAPPKWIHRVAWQGLLVGIYVGSLVTYLPLYAQTVLDFTVVEAGALASVFGIAGLTTRLVVPPIAMRTSHVAIPMLWLAATALFGCFLLWISPSLGDFSPWIASMMLGALTGWTALGMLSVITRVEQAGSGAASGVVTRGFTLGTAMGPVLFGFLIELTSGYELGLLVVSLCITGAALLILLWLRSERPSLES